MRLDQITQALEIAKTKSINKAAQNLFMAQSSLSSSISNLEKELGREIFLRNKNRLELTDFGARFIEEAEEIRLHYQTILDMAGMEGLYASERFGLSIYYLLFATRAFTEMCNDLDLKGRKINYSFRETTRMEIIQDVADGVSELGVLTMPSIRKKQWLALFDSYDLEYHVLTREPPFVIFGDKTALWKKNYEEVDISFLTNQRMLVMEEKNEMLQSIDREIMQRFRFGTYLGVRDRGSFMSVLKNTNSYYLVTTNQNAYRDGSFYEGLKSIPIRGMGDFTLEIAYTKKKKEALSPLAKEYISRLEKILGLE